MSTLKDLLKGVPVEWKALGDVTSVLRGRRLTKSQLISEGYPVFHGGLEPLGYYKDYNRNANSVMIINVGASAGNVGFSSNDFWSSDGCYCLAQVETINSRYLYYFLLGNEYYLKSKVRYAGIPTLDSAIIEKLQTPIPYPNDPEKSLNIQQEIVRVLDGLSEQNKALTSALAQEIDQRKKQYEYYREELFRFEGKEVEWKTLGENISKTSNIKWSHTDGNFRYIDLSSVDRDKKFITETTEINAGNAPSRAQKIVLEDDVIFATTRPTQMRVCLITEEFSNQIASTGFCILRAVREHVLPKWLFYQLTTNSFKSYLEENQSGIAYPAISDAKVKEFKIPIPFPDDKERSILEQERIVRLLDQFDEASKSIVSELEKEIELRNKQYEYYRDILLTFPTGNK